MTPLNYSNPGGSSVPQKPTYEELEEKVRALEKGALDRKVTGAPFGSREHWVLSFDEAAAIHNRAQEELRQEESKYRRLVESSLTGIYIDQDRRIVFANSKFAEIYGYPQEELIGMETWRLVHPDDLALVEEIRDKRLAGQTAPSEYKARGLTRNGKTIWVKRRNTRIEFETRPAILGNIVDITKQKEAEEELRKTNEELQGFLHAVSHDLKNPIVSIQGFSSRLLKKCGDVLGKEGIEYVGRIQESANRMEVLVSDLVTLSRIGRVVSKSEETDSLDLVRKVTSALEERLRGKNVELVVAGNLPKMYCDPERIYQVFENLILNAVKYRDESKQSRVEIGHKDGSALHQFYVKDNGIGIAPPFHKKVFEMFHRLDPMNHKEGTGLGLAIVQRIVEQHGGRAWVESEAGQGATFYFTLSKKGPQACH
jgi:two-component system sensor kinase FixL